jgi:hypothetical protein
MLNVTEAGTTFIRDGTPLPKTLRIESEPYESGWRLVKDLDGDGLGRKIQGMGWTFFCLAGHIRATAFGREGKRGIQSAIQRMLGNLESEKFNSLEITGVVSKRFLGLPYVTVSARSRHIQDSVFLFRDNDIQEWDREKLAPAA